MRIILLAASVLITLSFANCRSGRTISKAIAPRDSSKIVQVKNSADSLLLVDNVRADIQKNHIDFRTFSAKIKMDIEDSKGKKPDLLAVVRIIKDSAIWISVSATILNIEVYRAYITKDSVILLNKQDKEVQYRSLDYLQDVTSIPFDFKTLQDLFIGNIIFFNEKNITVKKYDDLTMVSSVSGEFKNLVTMNNSDKTLRHIKLDDADASRNRTADLTYDSYSNSPGFMFATNRRVIVSEKNRIDIFMNFKQFEFNKELSMPFAIPKNYKKN